MNSTIYTLGHSTLQVGPFEDLLREAEIEVLVDVRFRPFSRYCPHFNRRALEQRLGSAYVWEGKALGSPTWFGQPPATPAAYLAAIERVIERAASERLALMCAEARYTDCHRHTELAPSLLARGVNVCHLRLNRAGHLARTLVFAETHA